jgi:hypothetical protein
LRQVCLTYGPVDAGRLLPKEACFLPGRLEFSSYARASRRNMRRGPVDDDYSLESYILGLNHYQVELLANLDQVPEAGGLVWVTTRRSMTAEIVADPRR